MTSTATMLRMNMWNTEDRISCCGDKAVFNAINANCAEQEQEEGEGSRAVFISFSFHWSDSGWCVSQRVQHTDRSLPYSMKVRSQVDGSDKQWKKRCCYMTKRRNRMTDSQAVNRWCTGGSTSTLSVANVCRTVCTEVEGKTASRQTAWKSKQSGAFHWLLRDKSTQTAQSECIQSAGNKSRKAQ